MNKFLALSFASLLAFVGLAEEAALVWTTGKYTPADWTPTPTAANVLAGLEGVVYNKYTIWYTVSGKSLGNDARLLTDGVVPGATVDYTKIAAIKTSGSTITWTFDAADVQEIRIYSRYDGGRDGISISKVEIQQSGSDAFSDLNTSVEYGTKAVDGNDNSGGALQAVLTRADASPIATSMTALKLTFGAQDNGGAGYVEIEVVRFCEHTWSEPTVVEVTCTTDGSITKTCTKCGKENVTVLSHPGHDRDESGFCQRCHTWLPDERSAFLASLSTNANRVVSSPFAKGGIIHKLGNDYIHIFTDVDKTTDFSVTNGDVVARVLLVAGGGSGGGKDGSAGGGAGGMVTADSVSFPTGAYAVRVGRGAPANTSTEIGVNGDNSSISNATEAVCTVALGGGGGGSKYDSSAAGKGMKGNDGGSGGGAGCYASGGAGKGTDGQGHEGGAYYGAQLSGGGGGAGSAGGNATSSKAGDGGEGLESDILGYAVAFAGGGGGGSRKNTTAGSEGLGKDGGGNGGRGQWSTENLRATDGVHGKGAGGGGSGGGNSGTGIRYGGAGGDGLVVIRYTDPTKVGTVPAVTLSSVTPNNDATATIAWSMTGKDPLTLKALYGVDSSTLNITNVISTTATAGEGSTTLSGLLPGRMYYVSLLAENSYGDSGAMLPTSFTMPADGPMPTTPTAQMPVIASKIVKDQTGGTTIDVVATLSQAGTGSSFADCTATVRWGTVNELEQMTSSKSASVASDGTVTISPDNLGTGTYYGCLEVVNAAGYMDRIFFSFSAADASTYQWKEGVTNGAWKDRNNWTGAPNDWGCGYPTDSSIADFTSANCATVHVAGVINCAKLKMEKANATYVFVGDDATAAVYPANANTTSGTSTILPDGGELVFDAMKVYLLCGNTGCYGLEGAAKVVLKNGAFATVRRGGPDDSKESFELKSSDARLEVEGVGSKILASNYRLAPNNKATAGGTVVLSGASPSLNVTSVSVGSVFAQCFDGTVVCNIPAEGWASPVIPSTKLRTFASGGSNSGSGKIVFTVPKTAPIRGAMDKTKTESVIVSCANGFEVSRITFGSTATSGDYFYYTLGDAKYVYCTTNATKLAAIDAPGVALETQPAVTALKYHHEPPKGLLIILL